MPQIGFTDKQAHVYARFQKMRRDYEDANGRTYAPDFLTVLMDGYEALEAQSYANPTLRASGAPQFTTLMVNNFLKQHFPLDPEPVSFRAYIADAEANDPSLQKVVIKQSDGAQYLEKMLAHNHNAYLTPHKNEAMVFDSRDQAKAFLRKCGRDVADWILEPVN